MKILFLILLPLYALADESIEIHLDGKLHTSVSMDAIKKMNPENIEFYNHVTKRAELYKGVSTLHLLEKQIPAEVKNIAELELTSENDYKTFVPYESLQKLNSILSYERADGDTFKRYSQKKKMLVNLAPLYLVWDLKGVPKEEKLYYSSVYQIKKINLITKNLSFGVHESSVDESVYLGLQSYKKNCIMCHAVGKTGGDVSFDLVKRKTLEIKSAEYIKKYILDPHKANPKTHMLPLPQFKNREELAQGIVDFLKFMQNPEAILAAKKAAENDISYKELKTLVNEMK